MFDGVIFDVDGTIWDSTRVVEDAWNAALIDAGYEERVTAARLKGLFGLPMDDIIKDILPNAADAERAAFAPMCYKNEHDYLARTGGDVYDGMKEMLEKLSLKYPLFIVSNCQAGYIELMLKKTGFGSFFKDHLCPGDTNLLKADNIRLISERNGLKAPIYVGDTQMDANACKQAGVPIVFAAYGFGKVEEPYGVINTPLELLDVIK